MVTVGTGYSQKWHEPPSAWVHGDVLHEEGPRCADGDVQKTHYTEWRQVPEHYIIYFTLCPTSVFRHDYISASFSNSVAPVSSDESDQKDSDRSSASPSSSCSNGKSWHFLTLTGRTVIWPSLVQLQYFTNAIDTYNFGLHINLFIICLETGLRMRVKL